MDIPENDSARTPAAAPHQAVEVLGLHPGPPLHNETGETLVGRCLRVGSGVNEEVVRAFSAHDKTLLPVQEKMIPLVFGHGCGTEKVGPAPGFRQALGGKKLAFEKGFHVSFLLLIRAVEDDGVAHQFRPHAEGTGEDVAEGPDFFHDHAGGSPVHVASAPFCRIAASHEVSPCGLLEKLLGKPDLVLVHVQDHLPVHPADQLPGLTPDFVLFIRHHEVKHGSLPFRKCSLRLLVGLFTKPSIPCYDHY